MKINIHLALLTLVCAVGLTACHDKDNITISGEVKNVPEKVKKVYLVAADSSQLIIIDSVAFNENHEFEIKHPSPYTTFYKLLINGNMFDVMGKNGDELEFKTDLADSTNTYEIKNSPESDKLKEFNALSNRYSAITTQITNGFSADIKRLGKDKADSLVKVYKPRYDQNMLDYGNAVYAFGQKYSNSLIGFFAMKSLDRVKFEQQLVAYAEQIKGKFPHNYSVNMFVASILELKPTSVGQKAPDFSIPGLDGKAVKLSDYKGKYLMIDFWASWCKPCREENPNVVKMYAQFKDKGLNILGISLDEKRDDWQRAVTADHLNWQHASEMRNFDSPVVQTYRVSEIPSNFIINPDGVIIAKNIFGTQLEEFLKKTFSKAQQKVN